MNNLLINHYATHYIQVYQPESMSRNQILVLLGKCILNSIGMYPTSALPFMTERISDFKSLRNDLQNVSIELMERRDNLERKCKIFKQKLNPSTSVDFDKIDNLKKDYYDLLAKCTKTRTPNRLLNAYRCSFFESILDLLTLGFYSNYKTVLASRKARCDCEVLQKVIQIDIKNRIQSLNPELIHIEQELANIKILKEIQVIDIPAVTEMMSRFQSKESHFRNAMEEERVQKDAIKELNDEIQSTRASIQQIANAKERVEAEIANSQGLEAQLTPLQVIEQEIEKFREIEKTCLYLPPRYVKRAEDLNVSGAPGINSDDDDKNGIQLTEANRVFAKKVNTAKTSWHVFREYLCETVKTLKEREKSPANPFIKKLSSSFKNSDELGSLYCYIALNMIKWGVLLEAEANATDCGGPYIALNDNGVRLESSKPARVLVKKVTSAGQAILDTKVIATKRCDFTPHKLEGDMTNGIDPLSLKWIWAQLNETERDFIERDILTPLVKENYKDELSPSLDQSRIGLIELATKMIGEMGIALEQNFSECVQMNLSLFLKK